MIDETNILKKRISPIWTYKEPDLHCHPTSMKIMSFPHLTNTSKWSSISTKQSKPHRYGYVEHFVSFSESFKKLALIENEFEWHY